MKKRANERIKYHRLTAGALNVWKRIFVLNMIQFVRSRAELSTTYT